MNPKHNSEHRSSEQAVQDEIARVGGTAGFKQSARELRGRKNRNKGKSPSFIASITRSLRESGGRSRLNLEIEARKKQVARLRKNRGRS